MSANHAMALGALLIGLGAGLSASGGFATSLTASSEALTPYRTCVVTATPSSTTLVIDAVVGQSNPNTNYGSINTMEVTSQTTSNRRVHIRFDLSGCTPAIPSGATIRLATLRLYATGFPNGCRTVDIFRVTASWTETGVTWLTQPFGVTLNNPPTGQRSDSYNIGTSGSCENATAGYISGADVTSDVAAFIAGTATNYGWMLRDDSEGSGSARTSTYSTKNLGTLAEAPQLVVTYVTVP